MDGSQFLALLSWQGQKILKEDILKAQACSKSVSNPENLVQWITSPKVKYYISQNPKWWKICEADIKKCKESQIQLTWPGQKDWPKQLDLSAIAPCLLSYKGNPSWNDYFQFCVVGSRKSHPHSLQWMDHYLGTFIKNHNISILSGGARGIDQKAHSLSIRFQKPTLCFLPCGLNSIYPPSLKSWLSPILDTEGAFISPFPPNYSVRRSFFHYRNSIMVKMSHIIFVIQAEARSGSMMTAKIAGHLGKTLCTLPGPVMQPAFRGNLDLMSDGVLIIRDEKDLETLFYIENRSYTEARENPQMSF